MTASIDIRQRAIELIDKLPKEMLTEAVTLLESLSLKANQLRDETALGSEEDALLEIIQRYLSVEEQTRLDYLREQNEWEQINEAEHTELLAYEERLENMNVERVEALIKLAKIRKTDLTTLISEFKPKSSTYNGIGARDSLHPPEEV